MLNSKKMNLKSTFENPFEDINANVIDSKRIVDYWCSPFSQGLIPNFDEHKFRTSKMPVILQGSRGSGKTTILKYFSLPAQIVRADINNDKSLLKVIEREKEVGFYYRCDESFISTFKSVFSSIDETNWTKFFEHYLEMIFVKSILYMLIVLKQRKEIDFNNEKEIIGEFIRDNSFENYRSELSIDGLYSFINDQISYINNFKNMVVFTDEPFSPKMIVNLFEYSESLITIIKHSFPEFENVLFVFMFDEFENLTLELQKRFNTLIKFAKTNISIRVGRRSEGIITSATINETEYLRENHDYYLALLEREVNSKNSTKVKNYFYDIAKRRLALADETEQSLLDIIYMFGDKENYVEECKAACNGNKTHIKRILEVDPKLKEDEQLKARILEIIKNDDNPIAETLNALWVIREKKDYIAVAQNVAKIMDSFFNQDGKEDIKKYKNDYVNKYKYSITTYICSVYKRPKLYYGFNAICYLSNGNIRTFINLCRTIISDALFFEKGSFIETGQVSKMTQSRAIHNFSQSEFDEICSIIKYGDNIRNLILNLGNIFSAYHKDRKIRYPETNQFVFNDVDLYPDDRNIIDIAISWAMIIKKNKPQRITASIDKKADIYYINKIFCPIFNISYRTRGGVNPTFNKDDMHNMLYHISHDSYDIKEVIEPRNHNIKAQKDNIIDGQLTIFDMIKDTPDEG